MPKLFLSIKDTIHIISFMKGIHAIGFRISNKENSEFILQYTIKTLCTKIIINYND